MNAITITKAEDVSYGVCYAAIDSALNNPDPNVDAYTQAVDTICDTLKLNMSDKERLRLRGRVKVVGMGRLYGMTGVSIAKMLTKS